MYFVYILECTDGTLYTGITTDLDRRFRAHASGRGARYVTAHGAKAFAYTERRKDRSRAQMREAAIKRMTRGEKLALIATRKKK